MQAESEAAAASGSPSPGRSGSLGSAPAPLSKIPSLSAQRFGANLGSTRLPSPPISPCMSSPSTPNPHGTSLGAGNSNGLWSINSGKGGSGIGSGWSAVPQHGTPVQGLSLSAAVSKAAADEARLLRRMSSSSLSSASGIPAPSTAAPAAAPPATAFLHVPNGVSSSLTALPSKSSSASIRMEQQPALRSSYNGEQAALRSSIGHFGNLPRPPTPTGSTRAPPPGLLSQSSGPGGYPSSSAAGSRRVSTQDGLDSLRASGASDTILGAAAAAMPAAAAAPVAAKAAAGAPAAVLGASVPTKSSIMVAVRLRPLSEKERGRGDKSAWAIDADGNVGTLDRAGAFTPKHRYDTVFGPSTDNERVYCTVAQPMIGHALQGFNGTVFAYGVTSSGKTHTMMGSEQDPGIVPRIIQDLFRAVGEQAACGSHSFSVRMSMMEIYNEVLNDLLDPGRANLKVYEDARSGVVAVEGLLEARVSTAHEALALVARGDHNRKVGCTAFNEDSSRSHTITRILVESTELQQQQQQRPDPTAHAPAHGHGRRTLACLDLIDLAGSESARAVMSKGQRMEGGFINKSLLTLGTVIHKLAAGHTGHVPFRDSKLTRLLQPSLGGAGARVAVVCNITPAAGQAEETSNTLKFASRAKLVQVTVRANEQLDEAALLRNYRREVAELRRQLAAAHAQLAALGAGGGASGAALAGAAADELQALRCALAHEEARNQQMTAELTVMKLQLVKQEAVTVCGGAGSRASTDGTRSAGGEPYPSDSDPLTGGPSTSSVPGYQHLHDTLRQASSEPDIAASAHLVPRSAPLALGIPPLQVSSSPTRSPHERGVSGSGAGARGPGVGVYAPQSAHHLAGSREVEAASSSPRAASTYMGGDDDEIELDDEQAPVLGGILGDLLQDVRTDPIMVADGLPQPRSSTPGAGAPQLLAPPHAHHQRVRSGIPNLSTGSAQPGLRTSQQGSSPRHLSSSPTAAAAAAAAARAGGGVPAAPSSAVLTASSSFAGLGCGEGTLSELCGSEAGTIHDLGSDSNMDLEMQILKADNEVLQDQLSATEAENERLLGELARMREQNAVLNGLTRQAKREMEDTRRILVQSARWQKEVEALRRQLAHMSALAGVSSGGAAADPGSALPGRVNTMPSFAGSFPAGRPGSEGSGLGSRGGAPGGLAAAADGGVDLSAAVARLQAQQQQQHAAQAERAGGPLMSSRVAELQEQVALLQQRLAEAQRSKGACQEGDPRQQ